jgi:hypothetical protein
VFLEVEAYLLRAELEWRGGIKLERLEPALKLRVKEFKTQLGKARELFQGDSRPLTELRSLTLARELGQKPDPAIAVALKDVLAKAADGSKEKAQESAAAIKKLIAENKGKQFDIACAAFDLAADDANPTSDKIRFLAQLLKEQDPQPRYVETLAIYRLADMANYLRQWPTATTRRALDMVRKGELAVSRPRVFPFVRSLLDEAAQDRHIGDVFLWTFGYVSVDIADNQLEKAVKEYRKILDFEDNLLQAERSLDEALIRLPTYLPYLERPNRNDKAKVWLDAAQNALELRDALSQFPDPKKRVIETDLGKKVDNIRRLGGTLQSRLDDFGRDFESHSWQEIINRSKQSDANASVYLDIESMLATPILKASDRITLWKAGQSLSGRLNQETFKQDQDEDQQKQATKALSDFELEQDRWAKNEQERAARRASWTLALLKLSGLPVAEVEKLEETRKQAAAKPDAAAWDTLAHSLRKAWVDTRLDDPNPNALLLKQTLELKEWLTRRFRYESLDGPSSDFYAKSDRDYRADPRLNLTTSTEASIQFLGDVQVSSLTSANPKAQITLRLKLVGAAAVRSVEVDRFTADDDWLQVDVADKRDLLALKAAETSCTLPINIALKAGAQSASTPKPWGFLVQARVNDRVFHYKVPVSLVPLEILLSTNATAPKDPINELALRPSKDRLKYYLYVRNLTDKPYRLRVDLLDGKGAPIEGGSFGLPDPLQPNDWKPIVFGKAPPNEKSFIDMQRPLQIRLFDLDANKELAIKQIPVRIASPRDYVQVLNKEFHPNAGKKNKLQVEVRPNVDIPEPGCEVKLVLDPDRIKGYTPGREEGNFSEFLTKKEDKKVLTASGMQLDEGSDPNGFFYLTVDGVPRAFIFKTTFNRDGDTTYPNRFDAPDIRFRTPKSFNSNNNFEVEVNVDNPPEGATVVLELGKESEDGKFDVVRPGKPYPARYQHLGVSPQSPDGAILFEAFIADRKIPVDVHDIVGKQIVRATLRSADGTVIKSWANPITLDNTEPTHLKLVRAQQIANGIVEITVKGGKY